MRKIFLFLLILIFIPYVNADDWSSMNQLGNVLAFYNMNNVSGMTDNTGNRSAATKTGNWTYSSSGKVLGSYTDEDYDTVASTGITLVNLLSTGANNGVFTVTAWVNATGGTNNGQGHINIIGDSSEEIYIGYTSTTYVACYYGTAGPWICATVAAKPLENGWDFIAFTYTGVTGLGNITLWVNGTTYKNTNSGGVKMYNAYASTMNLGRGNAGNGYVGNFDDVGFWRRALNSSEIDFLYNSNNGREFGGAAEVITTNSLNVTSQPTYPKTNESLNCSFITNPVSTKINASILWWNSSDGTTWNLAKETQWYNIVSGLVYNTTDTNGSYTAAKSNYTRWTCQVNTTAYLTNTSFESLSTNATQKNISPLVVTVYSPSVLNASLNNSLSVIYNASNYDGAINCSLNVNGVDVNYTVGVTTDVLSFLSYNISSYGSYSWYIGCNATGDVNVFSDLRQYYYTTLPVTYNSSIEANSTTLLYHPELAGYCGANSTNATAILSYDYKWYINRSLFLSGTFYNAYSVFASYIGSEDTNSVVRALRYWGQPFVSPSNINISMVTLKLQKEGTSFYNFNISLRNTLVGNDIIYGTLDVSTLTTSYKYVNISFNQTFSLIANNTYYLVLSYPLGSGVDTVGFKLSNPGLNDSYLSNDAGATWITQPFTISYSVYSLSSSQNLQGINTSVNNLTVTSTGNYTFSCRASDIIIGISSLWLNSSVIMVTAGPATYSNNFTNETVIYPQSGEDIELNITVHDDDLLRYCYLYTNDTGIWANEGLNTFDDLSTMVAFYSADSTTIMPDVTGRHLDATMSGTVTTTTGILGNAWTYDIGGNNWRTGITVDDLIDVATGDASINTWAYPTTTNARDVIADYDHNFFMDKTATKFSCKARDYPLGNSVTVETNSTYSINNWYMISCVLNNTAGILSIYLNGTYENAVTLASGSVTSVSSVGTYAIGGGYYSNGGYNSFGGKIDETGFWGRVLTNSDISYLYNSGSAQAYPFTMDETQVTPAPANTLNVSFVYTTTLLAGPAYWMIRCFDKSGNFTNSSYYEYYIKDATPATMINSIITSNTSIYSLSPYLQGFCEASSSNPIANLTYFYNWYVNQSLYLATNYSLPYLQGVSINVDNITVPSSGNYTLECMAQDVLTGFNSTWLNSTAQIITYSNTVLSNFATNETSVYPLTTQEINLSFNFNSEDAIQNCSFWNNDTNTWTRNVSVSFITNSGYVSTTWIPKFIGTNVLSYNYWTANCTDEWGNSTASAIRSYTVKNYTAPVINQSLIKTNSSVVSGSPNLQGWCNANSTNATALLSYNYRWHINQTLQSTIYNVLTQIQGIPVNFTNLSAISSGNYTFSCQANDTLMSLVSSWLNSSTQIITYSNTTLTNIITNETTGYPLPNQFINLSFNFNGGDITQNCSFWNNDSETWSSNITKLFTVNTGYVSTTWVPKFIGTNILSYNYWNISCIDEWGNTTASALQSYTVKNYTAPLINYSAIVTNTTILNLTPNIQGYCRATSQNSTANLSYLYSWYLNGAIFSDVQHLRESNTFSNTPLEYLNDAYAYYNMNNLSAITDNTGNHSAATVSGTWTYFADGKISGAYDDTTDISGANTGFTFAQQSSNGLNTGAFTWVAWVNFTGGTIQNVGTSSYTMAVIGDSDEYIFLGINGTDISFCTYSTSWGCIHNNISLTPKPLNNWVMLTASYSNGITYIYFNGQSVGYQSRGVNSDIYIKNIKIGSVGANGMTGGIDSVGFYKRVLNQSEINDLYNSGTGRSFPFGTGLSTKINGTNWRSQTFTTSTNYYIQTASFNIKRVGVPLILNASLRATLAGVPTGGNLASGSLDTTSVTGAYGFFNINFTTTPLLSSGTTYALIISYSSGDETNYIETPIIAGSGGSNSINSGAVWVSDIYNINYKIYDATNIVYVPAYGIQNTTVNVQNFTPTSTGNYTLDCMAEDVLSGLSSSWLNSSIVSIQYDAPLFSSMLSNETSIYPNTTYPLLLNYTVQDQDLIKKCSIWNNDTAVWVENRTTNYNDYIIYESFVWNVSIAPLYPALIARGYWYVNCTDAFGNYTVSLTQNYTVKNFSAPRTNTTLFTYNSTYLSGTPVLNLSCNHNSTNTTARLDYYFRYWKDGAVVANYIDASILQGTAMSDGPIYPLLIGTGYYNGSCRAVDVVTQLDSGWTNTRQLLISNGPTIFSNVLTNETVIYPNTTYPLNLSFNAADVDTMTSCSIWNNDTNTWTINKTFSISTTSVDLSTVWNVSLSPLYPAILAMGYWNASCTDSFGEVIATGLQYYSVKNLSAPQTNYSAVSVNTTLISQYPYIMSWYNANSTNSTARLNLVIKSYVNSSLAQTTNVAAYLQGVTASLVVTYPALIGGSGNWTVGVQSIDAVTNFIGNELNSSIFSISYGPTIFTNNITNSTFMYPQKNNLLVINVTIRDNDTISWCIFSENDTGVWTNHTNLTQINSNNYIAQYTYNVTLSGNGTNNVGYYRVQCEDEFGINNISEAFTYSIKDFTLPVAMIGSGNSFSADNKTIISPSIYDLNINFTYFDWNLFGVNASVYCDEVGTIFSYEMDDVNTTTYNITATVDLNYSLNPQRCTFTTYSSDDHTRKHIKDYNHRRDKNVIEFEPEIKMFVNITGDTDENEVRDINVNKNEDRYEIEFKFRHNSRIRIFTINSTHKIYYRPDSAYNAHFVVWNEETGSGNWLDFEEEELLPEYYAVEKINDYEYRITITTPFNKKDFNFKSIGGTNINNASYLFYIGAELNISSRNLYNNVTINDAQITISGVSNYSGIATRTQAFNGTTTIYNISSGDYLVNFTSVINHTLPVYSLSYNITTNSQALNYTSSESTVTVYPKNIVSGIDLTNYNMNITDVNATKEIFFVTNYTGAVLTIPLNGSGVVYNINITKGGYVLFSTSFTQSYLLQRVLIANLSFYATFNLYDEKTLGVFDITKTDNVTFSLFCKNSTYISYITVTSPEFIINCSYIKFRFTVNYNSSWSYATYYRTFIIDPDETLNVPVYLIDVTNTLYSLVYLTIEDLYSLYENESIYVKKIIGANTIQITADNVDIENKITAIMMTNNEYIIEIHSSNNPVRVMGVFTPVESGYKSIRLYDVNLGVDVYGFLNTVFYTAGTAMANTSSTNLSYQDKYATFYYNDTSGLTNSVTINIRKDSEHGAVLFTYTAVAIPVFTYVQNITEYNNTRLFTEATVIYDGVQQPSYVKAIQTAIGVTSAFMNYFTAGQKNWFFIILFSIMAIYATISSAVWVAVAIVAMAFLFIAFNWLTVVYVGTLVLSLLLIIFVIIRGKR